MEDLKTLEFLAVNSKEIIEKQVDSHRQQHSYAGTIIGATALYIPFFMGSFDSTSQTFQFVAIIPTTLFIDTIILIMVNKLVTIEKAPARVQVVNLLK
jgi:hypothetical protein